MLPHEDHLQVHERFLERIKMSERSESELNTEAQPEDALGAELHVIQSRIKNEWINVRALENEKTNAFARAREAEALINAKRAVIEGFEIAANSLSESIDRREDSKKQLSDESSVAPPMPNPGPVATYRGY